MGNFISNFDTTAELTAFSATTEFGRPHVSLTKDTGKVHYFEPHDYSKDYLTFRAREQGTFKLTIGSAVTTSTLQSISYSTDNGETWTTTNNMNGQTVTITTPTVNTGDKVLWKGTGVGVSTTINNSNRPSTSSIFSSTGEFDAEGNILSLIWGDDFIGKDYVVEGSSYNFALLFYANTGHVGDNYVRLVSAKHMSLPMSNVTDYCFFRMFQQCGTLISAPSHINANSIGECGCGQMFYQCSNLANAPENIGTPSTTLSTSGCQYVFYGCTSLTTAPELPATTLTNKCYRNMFELCTSLTTAPELPATTLATDCYWNMFRDCSSLMTAPSVLPATTLADGCCASMFQNCTSLTASPSVLPATTLASHCYSYMFDGCRSLTTAPELPATTLADYCYLYMFNGCTGLETAPELPATTLADSCYDGMFRGCTSLSSIKCLATDISATNCTYNWVYNVAANGTFTKNSGITKESWGYGPNGIPNNNWTVVDA